MIILVDIECIDYSWVFDCRVSSFLNNRARESRFLQYTTMQGWYYVKSLTGQRHVLLQILRKQALTFMLILYPYTFPPLHILLSFLPADHEIAHQWSGNPHSWDSIYQHQRKPQRLLVKLLTNILDIKPFFNKRYIKGVPFLPKWYMKG